MALSMQAVLICICVACHSVSGIRQKLNLERAASNWSLPSLHQYRPHLNQDIQLPGAARFASTLDGRIFVHPAHGHKHSYGFQVFRPEKVQYNADGSPNFQGAFSPFVFPDKTERGASCGGQKHVALCVPDRTNIYRMDGDLAVYEPYLFDAAAGNLRRRKVEIKVSEPFTSNAAIHSVTFTEACQNVAATGMIEPTITADGRLLILKDGVIRYTTTDQPCSLDWKPFKELHLMKSDPDVQRYPMARVELKHTDGKVAGGWRNEIYGGYPWVDFDGRNVFFTAANCNRGSICRGNRREGWAALGADTGGKVYLVDGMPNGRSASAGGSEITITVGIMWNFERERLQKQMLSGVHDPFKFLPVTPVHEVQPIFSSHSRSYSEVNMVDVWKSQFFDILFLPFNERLVGGRKKTLNLRSSPDVSPHSHIVNVHDGTITEHIEHTQSNFGCRTVDVGFSKSASKTIDLPMADMQCKGSNQFEFTVDGSTLTAKSKNIKKGISHILKVECCPPPGTHSKLQSKGRALLCYGNGIGASTVLTSGSGIDPSLVGAKGLTVHASFKVLSERDAKILSHDDFEVVLHNGVLQFFYDGAVLSATDETVTTNEWHHVAGRICPATGIMTLFLDGRRVAEQSITVPSVSHGRVRLSPGKRLKIGDGFHGLIDEVRLVARARHHRSICKSAPGADCAADVKYDEDLQGSPHDPAMHHPECSRQDHTGNPKFQCAMALHNICSLAAVRAMDLSASGQDRKMRKTFFEDFNIPVPMFGVFSSGSHIVCGTNDHVSRAAEWFELEALGTGCIGEPEASGSACHQAVHKWCAAKVGHGYEHGVIFHVTARPWISCFQATAVESTSAECELMAAVPTGEDDGSVVCFEPSQTMQQPLQIM